MRVLAPPRPPPSRRKAATEFPPSAAVRSPAPSRVSAHGRELAIFRAIFTHSRGAVGSEAAEGFSGDSEAVAGVAVTASHSRRPRWCTKRARAGWICPRAAMRRLSDRRSGTPPARSRWLRGHDAGPATDALAAPVADPADWLGMADAACDPACEVQPVSAAEPARTSVPAARAAVEVHAYDLRKELSPRTRRSLGNDNRRARPV
jgi:hypothetical protein